MSKKISVFIFIFIFILSCQKTSNNQLILKINYITIPDSLHPHLVSDIRTHTICKSLYEGLTRISPEGETQLTAAKKVEISPCGKKYTFTLRDTKWSNGEKVTSRHFSTAWISAISGKSKCLYTDRFFIIKNAHSIHNKKLSLDSIGISTPSDNLLIVELEHPAPYFLKLVADPIYSPIYSEDSTVFNGPFTLESHDFNKKLVLVANPLYWDAKTVKLKGVEISFLKDIQTAFSEYENGKLDYLGSPFSNLPEDSINHLPNLRYKQACAPFWVFCNTKNPKLSSFKIRKALSHAIDRNELLTYVIPKQQESLYNILPSSITSLPSNNPFHIEQSLKLFKEGLKELNIEPEKFHLTLSHSTADDQKKIALYLKDQWEKIFGIKVTLRKDDWNSFYSKIISGDYEVGGCFICNLYNDPSYFMEFFNHAHSNFSRWENPEYQKYFTLANESKDAAIRKSYLQKAEEVLMKEMPVIPIYNHAHLYICNEKLRSFSAPEFNYADFKWAH